MWAGDCGALPVVDDDGHLAGIITDRDVCMTAYLRGVSLDQCDVGSAMTTAVVACGADDSLDQAQESMRAAQIRRLPVIDADGCPIGMLSLNDLALAAPRAENGRLGMRKESVLATLSAISQHRTSDPDA
jgi:CBS domain-containing protein